MAPSAPSPCGPSRRRRRWRPPLPRLRHEDRPFACPSKGSGPSSGAVGPLSRTTTPPTPASASPWTCWCSGKERATPGTASSRGLLCLGPEDPGPRGRQGRRRGGRPRRRRARRDDAARGRQSGGEPRGPRSRERGVQPSGPPAKGQPEGEGRRHGEGGPTAGPLWQQRQHLRARLHIHLQTGPAFPGATEGLPMPFTDFLADGKPVAWGELVKGMAVRPK